MLDNLGWRSLELRRYDARIAMSYKIVYGLVAIPVPSYFERPTVYTRPHPLAYRQIHSSVCYYYYPFSHDNYFFGIKHQLILSWIQILTLLNLESVRSTTHSLQVHTGFSLLLNFLFNINPIIFAHFTFILFFYLVLSHFFTSHTNTPCAHTRIILERGLRIMRR